MTKEIDNITAIENLIKDPNLRKLESQFGGFNIFESIGAVRRELRHSEFLAFLLDPSANHQLFDRFIKPFLFRVAEKTDAISVIDIDLLKYDDIQIRREWKNIDILIVSEQSEFVCAIENKIDVGESKDQLKKYHKTINQYFPKCKKQIFVFLTPEGIEASDTDNWISVSYLEVYETLKQLLKEHKETLGHDIHFAISQYKEIIERHIMTDTKITKLCRDIYKEHKQALDLIFENRPDALLEIKEHLVQYLKDKSVEYGIKVEHSTKTYIRFSVNQWKNRDLPFLKNTQSKKPWTSSRQVLLFEIVNRSNKVVIDLVIGPADEKYTGFREAVFSALVKAGILNDNITKLSESFSHATQFPLYESNIEFDNLEKVKEKLDKNLKIFMTEGGKKYFHNIVNVVNGAIVQFQ